MENKISVVITKTIFGEDFVIDAAKGAKGIIRKIGCSGAFIILEDGREVYAFREEYQVVRNE